MKLPFISLPGNLYLTDLFDVIIIALFLYSIFILFQRTRTYLIFIGSLFIIVLYLIATNFNLYLTSLFLQYFVGVSIIIFVVIFQSEIRKFFELLGLVGTRQIRVGKMTSRSPSVSELSQACIKMAHAKTGALIVLGGHDSLEHLTQTGIMADAIISEEIILSLFDPHSPGHDGAVVIEKGRIANYGVQLPLSKNSRLLRGYGTRHSAALGLSEQSDALVIVVSEEKGRISICREGRLKPLDNPFDLEKELDKYLTSRFGQKKPNWFKSMITHNPWLKSSAVLTAIGLWFLTAYQAGVLQKEFSVPVSFINQAEQVVIESYSPKEIDLVVSGRGAAAFSDTTAGSLMIELDASQLVDGVNRFDLNHRDITIPQNLSLVSFQPETVLLTARKYRLIRSPVRVDTVGSLAQGLELGEITITPATIELWIPASATPPAEIVSDPVNLDGLEDSAVLTVPFKLPESYRLPVGNPEVTVALTIRRQD